MGIEDEPTNRDRQGERTDVGKSMGTCLDNKGSFVDELISLVSEAKGEEPLELPPLYDTIDPVALHQLLESDKSQTTSVTFEYAGCEIMVTWNGEIFVLSLP